jgi:ATP-dependent helicase/nuclease subunit A
MINWKNNGNFHPLKSLLLPQLKVIRASAGSGKTYTLAGEYLRLLFTENDYFRHILAVTFTNKATNEMKSRIIGELDLLAGNRESKQMQALMSSTGLSEVQLRSKASVILKKLLHRYSDFSVSTIDSFFQRIIRSFTRELGLQGTYSIELDTETLLTAVIDKLLIEAENDKPLLNWLGDYAESLIERGENWNLRKSMRSLGKEIFREEFKSHSSLESSQYGNREFLQSFRKDLYSALQSIEKEYRAFGYHAKSILDSHGLTVDDFSRKGSGPAGFLVKLAAGEFREPTDTSRQAALNAEKWFTRASPDAIVIKTLAESDLMPLMLHVVDYYDTHSRRYYTLEVVLKNLFTLGILSDLSRLAYQWCNENNAFLLPEAPLFLQKIIDGNDTPFIYEKAGYWYHHFMIDEFQDTSLLQWLNFKPLISNSLSQDYDNLVVGDVKQSIYRWRNSNWTILSSGVEREFPGGIIQNMALEYNWRSSKNIIEFNNRFFNEAAALLEHEFLNSLENEHFPVVQFGESPIRQIYGDIFQKQGNGKFPDGKIRISFVEGDSENSFYDKVNEQLVELLGNLLNEGYQPADIAIITRKNKEAKQLADLLLNYEYEHPDSGRSFKVISDEALRLGSSSVVVFLASLLQFILDPNDRICTYYLLSFYQNHYAGDSPPEKWVMPSNDADTRSRDIARLLPPEFIDLISSAGALSLAEIVERLISIFSLSRFTGEQVYLDAFRDLVQEYGQKNAADPGKFQEFWNETGKERSISAPAGQDAIRILTVHKAKGLEFNIVIIPYCDWDLNPMHNSILWCHSAEAPFDRLERLPVYYSAKLKKTHFAGDYYEEYLSQYIDNLNLLYVAFTRACSGLYVFCKPGKQDQLKNVSDLASNVLKNGLLEQNDNVFSYGRLAGISHKPESVQLEKFLPANVSVEMASKRIQVAYQGKLYIDPAVDRPKRPLSEGKLLHEIFMGIRTISDIIPAVTSMFMHGKINEEEKEKYTKNITSLVNNKQVQSWFNAEWKVLTEAEIILPEGISKRPDRVITREGQTVIIDYKFGEKEDTVHKTQVLQYIDLLKKMGYTNVRGYLWYAGLEKIVEVREEF